jgi:hypothetical protein
MELQEMHKTRCYRIEVQNEVDEEALNAFSPLQVSAVSGNTTLTVLKACADQSAIIGLLFHLHQQGYLILSFAASLKENANEQ